MRPVGGRGVTTVLPRGGGRPVSVVPSGPAARSQSPRAEREQRERQLPVPSELSAERTEAV